MTCLFPLNSETYWGARRSTWEEREYDENASSYMQIADGSVAVLFFSRVPVSFPLFLVPLSFTFEL